MNHMNISQLNIRGIYKVPKVPKVLRIVPVRSRERERERERYEVPKVTRFKQVFLKKYTVIRIRS